MRAIFIKRNVTEREWKNFYQYNTSYCHLGFEGFGVSRMVKMGSVAAAKDNQSDLEALPKDCYLMTDDELLAYDNFCRANNVYPRPLADSKKNATR
ncbi:MAG: hypothetical protein ABIM64_05525 [candidate division WOR-3 bacterium]